MRNNQERIHHAGTIGRPLRVRLYGDFDDNPRLAAEYRYRKKRERAKRGVFVNTQNIPAKN